MSIFKGFTATVLILSINSVLDIECQMYKDAPTTSLDQPITEILYQNSVQMFENDIAKKTAIGFLVDVKDIMDNQTAHDIIDDITMTIKFVLGHDVGHKTVIALSDGIKQILKNPDVSNSINAFVQGVKTILGNENTYELMKIEADGFNKMLQIPEAPHVISIIGSAIARIISENDIPSLINNFFDIIINASIQQAKKY